MEFTASVRASVPSETEPLWHSPGAKTVNGNGGKKIPLKVTRKTTLFGAFNLRTTDASLQTGRAHKSQQIYINPYTYHTSKCMIIVPSNTKWKCFQVTWKPTSWNGFHPTKPRFCSSSDFTPFCKNAKEVILPDKTRLFPKEPYVDDRAVAFTMNTARRSLKCGTQVTAGPQQLMHRCWWGTAGRWAQDTPHTTTTTSPPAACSDGSALPHPHRAHEGISLVASGWVRNLGRGW